MTVPLVAVVVSLIISFNGIYTFICLIFTHAWHFTYHRSDVLSTHLDIFYPDNSQNVVQKFHLFSRHVRRTSRAFFVLIHIHKLLNKETN
jgi:hypothetical protein